MRKARANQSFLVFISYLLFSTTAASENIAVNRPAHESSHFNGSPLNPVDGNRGGSFGGDGCSETDYQANPWWYVELDDIFTIHQVFIYNRADCCSDRLHDFDVYLMDLPPDSNNAGDQMLCGHQAGDAEYETKMTCTPGTRGRYVVITIPGDNERLTLCEVEVYKAKFLVSVHYDPSDIIVDLTSLNNDDDPTSCVSIDESELTTDVILRVEIPHEWAGIRVTSNFRGWDGLQDCTVFPSLVYSQVMAPAGPPTPAHKCRHDDQVIGDSMDLFICDCHLGQCGDAFLYISRVSLVGVGNFQICHINVI